MEEVREIGRGQVMEGFKGHEQHFKLYPVFDWEPVEILEDRGDVISVAGMGEQTSSRVLDVLEFSEYSGRCPIEDAVAVVES